jgi:translation initiation factor IF-3
MDFGKYKYEQNKKAQKARKKQHITHLKEVKLRPKIEEHDYNFKVQHGREFLEEHDKVKFTVMFRGREMAHPEAGFRLLQKVVSDLEAVGQVEIPARMEGRSMTLLMVPRPQGAAKPAAPQGAAPGASKPAGSSKPAATSGSKPSSPTASGAKPAAHRPASPAAAPKPAAAGSKPKS